MDGLLRTFNDLNEIEPFHNHHPDLTEYVTKKHGRLLVDSCSPFASVGLGGMLYIHQGYGPCAALLRRTSCKQLTMQRL
jgi:hypothetical protein